MSAKKSAAKKSGAKPKSAAKSKTSRAKLAQTDPESVGIAGAKQQSALYRGGSLAQRRGGEGELGDAQSQSGYEVTSASPPNVRERGRVSSPSFDEVPVTGKARDRSDGARRSASGALRHLGASKVVDIDALEPGTSIEKIGGTMPEVRIRTAIAGGAIRIFSGATFKDALEQLNKFLQGDALLLPTASPAEVAAVRDANEANVRALKGKSTKQADRPRSRSGAKRR